MAARAKHPNRILILRYVRRKHTHTHARVSPKITGRSSLSCVGVVVTRYWHPLHAYASRMNGVRNERRHHHTPGEPDANRMSIHLTQRGLIYLSPGFAWPKVRPKPLLLIRSCTPDTYTYRACIHRPTYTECRSSIFPSSKRSTGNLAAFKQEDLQRARCARLLRK